MLEFLLNILQSRRFSLLLQFLPRIEKLEKGGYIEGYYAHINAQAFGFNIKAFINLEVEPVQKKEFYPIIFLASKI